MRIHYLTSLLALAGCATLSRGTVAGRIGDDQARVYLGSADGLAVGDRVALYRQDCLDVMDSNIMFMEDEHCREIPAGDGTVEEILGDHLARIKVDPGVKVSYGMAVNRIGSAAH